MSLSDPLTGKIIGAVSHSICCITCVMVDVQDIHERLCADRNVAMWVEALASP